jgi:hypothetical protein
MTLTFHLFPAIRFTKYFWGNILTVSRWGSAGCLVESGWQDSMNRTIQKKLINSFIFVQFGNAFKAKPDKMKRVTGVNMQKVYVLKINILKPTCQHRVGWRRLLNFQDFNIIFITKRIFGILPVFTV